MKRISIAGIAFLFIALIQGQNKPVTITQEPLSQKEINRRVKEKIALTESRLRNHTNHYNLFSSPEQDCNSAIAVCQNTYSQSTSYSGFGSLQEVPSSSCLNNQETNSVWYIFTVTSSGSLVFEITPSNSSDDYDFALYNITNNNCSGIPAGTAPEASCNYSGTPGNTGLSSSGTSNSQNASGTNQNAPLAVSTGQTYALIVDNFSSSQNGYTLSFAGSTASIFDNVPPSPQSISMVCGTNNLILQMSEAVTCASILTSTFTVTGPGGPFTINSFSGVNCGTATSQIAFNFSPKLQPGQTYTITADGLMDNCGNVSALTQLTFVAQPFISTVTPILFCNTTALLTTPSLGINYQWYNNSGAAISPGGNTDSLMVLSPVNGQVYSVGYTDTVTGCRDTIRYPLQQSSFNLNASPANTCSGGSTGTATLNASAGFAPYNYHVTGPGSYADSSNTNSTILALNNLAPGTYTAIINTQQCYDSLTFVIGINPVPVTNQTKKFCSSTFPLTIFAPSGSGQNNYQWYDTTGTLIAGATKDSLVIAVPANGNIYAVGFDQSNACRDSLRITLSQQTFTVSSFPSPSCYGAATGNSTLTAPSGFGPYTFHITGPGAYSASNTATSATYIASNLAPGTYTAVVTTAIGCYDSITIGIGGGTLAIATKHDSICPGDSKTFTSSISGTTHQWYSPSGIIAGATSQSYNASPAVVGIYLDTVKNASGCVSLFRDSVTQMNFSSSVISEINNPCYQDSVASISVSSAGGVTAYTYSWAGPGGFTGTGSTQSNLSSGTYTIITHSGNCKDSITATITEPSEPNDTLVINTTFCDGDTSAFLMAPSGFTNYQWYYNGTALPGETDTSIFILNPTSSYNNYSVTYIVLPCKRKTTVVFHSVPEALFKPEIVTNIFTPNGDGKNDLFHPFFNPLVSQHYIEYAADKYSIKIFDRWGLLVFESENYAAQWNGKNKSGKECGDGTYYWIATYSSRCGVGEVTTKTGFVMLQR